MRNLESKKWESNLRPPHQQATAWGWPALDSVSPSCAANSGFGTPATQPCVGWHGPKRHVSACCLGGGGVIWGVRCVLDVSQTYQGPEKYVSRSQHMFPPWTWSVGWSYSRGGHDSPLCAATSGFATPKTPPCQLARPWPRPGTSRRSSRSASPTTPVCMLPRGNSTPFLCARFEMRSPN